MTDTFNQSKEFISSPDITLFEFWEEGSSSRQRAAFNTEDVTHNGNTYTRAQMSINLPNSGDQNQQVTTTISNVSRIPGRTVLAANSRIQCRIIHVSGDDNDVALFDTQDMLVITDVTVDTITVSGNLISKIDFQMPYPFINTNKQNFPGLWL